MKTDPTTVLIIDDEESIRRNIREYLTDEGYDVLTGCSGEEGLSLLQHHAPSLSVVDIRLPGMDGNVFILEAHRILPCMKFIVFTGSMEYTLPQELQFLGLTEKQVIKKPLNDLSILSELIRMQCEPGEELEEQD